MAKEKERQYVVVVVYELCQAYRTELLGVTNSWSKAFHLIDACDYNQVIAEELTGLWGEMSCAKWLDHESYGKVSYNETHYFTCVSEEQEREYEFGCSVMFHIFEY